MLLFHLMLILTRFNMPLSSSTVLTQAKRNKRASNRSNADNSRNAARFIIGNCQNTVESCNAFRVRWERSIFYDQGLLQTYEMIGIPTLVNQATEFGTEGNKIMSYNKSVAKNLKKKTKINYLIVIKSIWSDFPVCRFQLN